MKINLIVFGKTKSNFLIEGEAEYVKRLKHYCKFSELIINNVKNSSKISKKNAVKKEGQLLLKSIERADYVILLDEKGTKLSSIEFSKFLNNKMNSSIKKLVFIVGGAFGVSEDVYKRTDYTLSLSRMTFSHQMIRLVFKEQLYRAFTIIKGESYHHK